jgi:mono/diheme cytochrome c family protein
MTVQHSIRQARSVMSTPRSPWCKSRREATRCIAPRAPSTKNLPLVGLAVGLTLLGGCNQGAPAFAEPMTLGGREVSPEVLNHGRDLYRQHCVSCHGDAGAGDGPAARNLKFAPADFQKGEFSFVATGQLPSHDALIQHIQTGAPDRGMPSWKGMRLEDLSALADYIKTFSPRWSSPSSNHEGGLMNSSNHVNHAVRLPDHMNPSARTFRTMVGAQWLQLATCTRYTGGCHQDGRLIVSAPGELRLGANHCFSGCLSRPEPELSQRGNCVSAISKPNFGGRGPSSCRRPLTRGVQSEPCSSPASER